MQTHKAWLAVTLCALGALAATGCSTPRAVSLTFHEQVTGPLPEGKALEVKLPVSELPVRINPFPSLTAKYIDKAEIYETAGGHAIMLQFDVHGLFVLEQLTTENRGRFLVILLNSRPVTGWLVDRRITNGQFLLEGDITDEEAQETVDILNEMSRKRW